MIRKLSLIFVTLFICAIVLAQAAEINLGESLTVNGTVDAVDYAQRILTIKEADGGALILAVSENIDNLSQIKSGGKAIAFNARKEIDNFYRIRINDKIIAQITEPLAVSLKKSAD